MSTYIERFKNKTNQYFQHINKQNANHIEDDIRMYLETLINTYALDIRLKDIIIYGSRSRGLEKVDSDLDVIVSYESNMWKEDMFFNLLHEVPYSIGEIEVDFNPILEYKQGILEDYLLRADKYMQEKAKREGIKMNAFYKSLEKYDESGRLKTIFINPHITIDKAGKNVDFYISYGNKHLIDVKTYEKAIKIAEELDRQEELLGVTELDPEMLEKIIKGNTKKRLFVDMDGTLTVFKTVDTLEKLYEQGYFLNLEPHTNVVDVVRQICTENPDVEVFIMSAVLTDSEYALAEKNEWLNKYLPEIDAAHRIFPPCGQDKKEYIPGGVVETDFLLDDYTHNLSLWEPPAKGIKLLNGINGTKGMWKGNMISYEKESFQIVKDIVAVMNGDTVKDIAPLNYAGLNKEEWKEFLEKEEYNSKHRQNLLKGVKKYINLGYDIESVKYLASCEARYIHLDDLELNKDMSLDELKAIIVHYLADHYTLQELHSRLNHNYSVIEYGTFDDELEAALRLKENRGIYNSLKQEFENVATDALNSITASSLEWGSWLKKIPYPNNPENYLDVDITGYSTRHEVICNVNVICSNNVVAMESFSFNTDVDNFSESVKEGMNTVISKFSEYLKEAVNYLKLSGNEAKIVIDGNSYKIIDSWKNGTVSYILGQDTNIDMEWYVVQATETLAGFEGIYTHEYDVLPNRETVEDTHINMISSIDIDRHEAEYGADGHRVFPHLNDEPKEIVTFTVAECREFHGLGAYYENIESLDTAISLYSSIDSSRMNGIPSIGVNIHKEGTESFEDIQMDIFSGKKEDFEIVDYVPQLKENAVVQKAVEQLKEHFFNQELSRNIAVNKTSARKNRCR